VVGRDQGNEGRFGKENGVWQDGALFIHFGDADRWVGMFFAFQSQSFKTDHAGNPIGGSAPAKSTERTKKKKKAKRKTTR